MLVKLGLWSSIKNWITVVHLKELNEFRSQATLYNIQFPSYCEDCGNNRVCTE